MAETEPSKPVMADPLSGSYRLLRRWWRKLCNEIDQPAVIAKVRAESGWTPRYAFMTAMSAGIAILGLLLSSPAVIIGAMLLSPLMGPIMGAGFALAIGDIAWLRESAKALALGVAIAVLFCALIVMISPIQTITAEIAARTRPNLFDLAVALFSALAGAYAMVRGREGTIVGVAIATALMPPLAVVGFGLAIANWTVFGGALVLFFTNLMTIALTAAVMARLYGFRTHLSSKQSLAQSIIIAVIFVGLAIPLGFSLRQIAWEANTTSQAQGLVRDQFADARVSQLDLDFDSDPIQVTASVLTPEIVDDAEAQVARSLERQLGRPFAVTIRQYRVGTASDAAETAQIAVARMQEQAEAAEREVTEVRQSFALLAGVTPGDVTVDRSLRRAVVRARPLPGAGLETYRALEARLGAQRSEWMLELVPPATRLPAIAMEEGAPSEAGSERLQLAIWAAKRVGAPLGVAGSDGDAEAVIALLHEAGIAATRRAGGAGSGTVALTWLAPDSDTQ
ncbi:DUF389 domain-containing protein [Parasphingopyxis marina]|uniref:DUF389 domain-containing protein n=1 Tax=Parasphingopyxis marina TaxID=2761622 RepID=A0A842HUA5_9SPHN|nr:DUF389 domain-containing protein [Parasphingopyxis marina]MBC2776602.1 DUF389 domain-containing protein [Parasphingopyxis marina]